MKGLILMYHRVADLNADPWELCVQPKHFREQLEILRQSYRVLPLKQLMEHLKSGGITERSVVVTFDDGYYDNFQLAKPSLEEFEMPATVFLVSGQIEKQNEFWWDELERIFLQPGTLPESVHLTIERKKHVWNLADSSNLSAEDALRYSKWRTDEKPPTWRHSTYYAIWQLMQPLDEAQKQDILHELNVWAGTTRESRPSHKTLSREQVSLLAQGEFMNIGAHSVTHPVLSKFSRETQRQEIEGSKAQLEEILGSPVDTFAYPHGEYSNDTISILRDAGFLCSCSTAPEVMKDEMDPFQLPRFQAMNWDGDQFSKQLLEWFGEK
ncbi:polysaccharide deacetylase family protein [bacterium]|nr:polysaccharide deacetylase family protein [bacterium]